MVTRRPRSGPPRSSSTLILQALRLLEITRDIGVQSDFLSAVSRLLLHAAELVGADRCTLFLADRTLAPGYLYAGVPRTGPGGVNVREIRVPITEHSVVGSCALTGTLVSVPDAYADERFDRRFDRVTGYRTHSLLAAPLKDARGNVIAVLQVRAGGGVASWGPAAAAAAAAPARLLSASALPPLPPHHRPSTSAAQPPASASRPPTQRAWRRSSSSSGRCSRGWVRVCRGVLPVAPLLMLCPPLCASLPLRAACLPGAPLLLHCPPLRASSSSHRTACLQC